MVKIADFFKKDNEFPEDKPRQLAMKDLQEAKKQPAEGPAAKDPSQIIKENLKVEDAAASTKLYTEAMEAVEGILSAVKNNQPLAVSGIKTIAERIADQIILGNTELVRLANQRASDDYLVCHLVNTAILAVEVAAGMVYTTLQLKDLSLAAMLYDIGMAQLEDIYSQPRKLTDEEYAKIKEHPLLGAEALSQIKDISQLAAVIASEHHELLNGLGYPRGIRSEGLNEFSRLVSAVDVFEALTHPRPFRKEKIPYDALKEIFAVKEGFDRKILKMLVERIGVYPVGSWVQLSTNETAQVIDINKESPLRPVVRIAFDLQGKKYSEEKSLDLLKNPTLYIKRAVSEQELRS